MSVRKRPHEQKKTQKKAQKKQPKTLMIICLCVGIGIGVFTDFSLKDFIDSVSKYKLVLVKNDAIQEISKNIKSEVDSTTEVNTADLSKESKEESNSKNQNTTANVEEEKKEKTPSKKEPKQETTQDKIDKAKQAIIQQCGNGFSDVIYIGDQAPERIKGDYYIFGINIDGEVAGDMMFYVDKNTYKVYEYSVDGYFGAYRNGDSDVFTYDMAVRRLENELGWDERRKYTLVEQDSDGYKIRTSFIAEPGSGEGLYYVTPDFLDICFE